MYFTAVTPGRYICEHLTQAEWGKICPISTFIILLNYFISGQWKKSGVGLESPLFLTIPQTADLPCETGEFVHICKNLFCGFLNYVHI